ncbi:MAG TPA: hypothetical protein VEC93_20550, partial [Anaerolineae bacterium]|nr:hypothetical protein [Anaerolineae bacterium]
YLKTLPDNLPPAIAGALLEGHANPNHILAALLNLAYHGALNVDDGNKDSLLPAAEQKPAFNLYAVDQNKITQPYEVTLIGKIFGSGGKKRDLASIHEMLFMSTPELKHQIDVAIAQAGYLQQGCQIKRRQYMAFGGAGLVMSLVLGLLFSLLLQQYTYLVGCPFLGIAASAAAFIAAGLAIPSRTKAGAKEAAKWEAFKRFLHDMSLKEAEKYKHQFAHWLPYAVAFGLEKDFVKKFAAANAPKPKWWGQPEEKPLDLSPEQAYAWVSASVIESGSSPESTQVRSKGVIRRLGQSDGEALPDSLLKHIQPTLEAFLKAGRDAFSKAPNPDEDKGVDFEGPKQG